MSFIKKTKDRAIKMIFGSTVVPRGLYELNQYFRVHGSISFEKKREDGLFVAMSENFNQGSIITQGRDEKELDKNIKDAILTAFEVPSSYAKEARLISTGASQKEYALA